MSERELERHIEMTTLGPGSTTGSERAPSERHPTVTFSRMTGARVAGMVQDLEN